MAGYKPPLVIIAPKGVEYSSITDEDFAEYQSRPWFMELTLEQYCAWVVTADTVRCNSSRVFTPPDPDFEWDVQEYAERPQSFFPKLAPGWLNASKCERAWFAVPKSVLDTYTYHYPPVGFKKGSSAVFSLNDFLKFEIEPFYHRDKFYLVWDLDPRPPQSNRTFTFEISPTRLFFQTLDVNVDNTVTTKYEFNLSV